MADLSSSGLAVVPPAHQEVPVSTWMLRHGLGRYTHARRLLCRIGKRLAGLYRAAHGCKPPTRVQYVDGRTLDVNHYSPGDWEELGFGLVVREEVERWKEEKRAEQQAGRGKKTATRA